MIPAPPPPPVPAVASQSAPINRTVNTVASGQLRSVQTRDASAPMLKAIEGFGDDAEEIFVQANVSAELSCV
jgi:hypothetical protein